MTVLRNSEHTCSRQGWKMCERSGSYDSKQQKAVHVGLHCLQDHPLETLAAAVSQPNSGASGVNCPTTLVVVPLP